MKKAQFSESQIVAILKEGEAGILVAQRLRKYGISRPRAAFGSSGTVAPAWPS